MSISRKNYILSLILFVCTVLPGFAQSTREVLTNAKIVELVRIGLSEELVIAKIKQSTCQCDTSTAALGKLKTAKVSNAIIMAMMDSGDQAETASDKGFSETVITVPARSPAKPAETRSSVETSAEAGPAALKQITEPGIYLFENGKMTAIEPTIFSGQKTSLLGSMLTYGIKSSKIRAVVRGKSANLQINDSKPEFYFLFSREGSNSAAVMSGTTGAFGASSPAEFILVEMRVKENSREAILGKANAFGASMGAPDKLIREYSFEKVRPGLFKVVPRGDLVPGEYCFYYAGGGGTGGKLFDFSVR